MKNIWLDKSYIYEPEAITIHLREFVPGKLLWISDFSIYQIKDKCITISNGFTAYTNMGILPDGTIGILWEDVDKREHS